MGATTWERVAWRVKFLLDDRAFSLVDRLRHVNPFGTRISLDDLVRRRLRRTADGERYFDMNGRKIFFEPDWPIKDDAELLRGVQIVLEEAYMRTSEFFWGPVAVQRGDVVFDVGGNLGTSAMIFAGHTGPRGRVYSFEPVFHDLLRRNVRENEHDNIQVVPNGVSREVGIEEFGITDLGIDSRADPLGHGGIRRSIDMLTLDHFAEQEDLERVDFVKMDIEGAEEAALEGAERLIARDRPKWSIASYHNDCGFLGGHAQHPKLLHLLRRHGYRMREVAQRHIYAW